MNDFKTVECEEFFNLMQSYRHSSGAATLQTYENVISYINKKFSGNTEFQQNDVIRYIGESTTFSLDTSKLYVVNSSEMYGGALYVADDICTHNYLISNNPEMFTLVYRENV